MRHPVSAASHALQKLEIVEPPRTINLCGLKSKTNMKCDHDHSNYNLQDMRAYSSSEITAVARQRCDLHASHLTGCDLILGQAEG